MSKYELTYVTVTGLTSQKINEHTGGGHRPKLFSEKPQEVEVDGRPAWARLIMVLPASPEFYYAVYEVNTKDRHDAYWAAYRAEWPFGFNLRWYPLPLQMRGPGHDYVKDPGLNDGLVPAMKLLCEIIEHKTEPRSTDV